MSRAIFMIRLGNHVVLDSSGICIGGENGGNDDHSIPFPTGKCTAEVWIFKF